MNIPISSDSVRLWAMWRCPSLFHCLFTNVNENDSEGKLLTPRFCCKWRKRTTGKPKGAPNSFGIRRNNEGDAQSTRQERLWHGTGSHDEGAEVLDPPRRFGRLPRTCYEEWSTTGTPSSFPAMYLTGTTMTRICSVSWVKKTSIRRPILANRTMNSSKRSS